MENRVKKANNHKMVIPEGGNRDNGEETIRKNKGQY